MFHSSPHLTPTSIATRQPLDFAYLVRVRVLAQPGHRSLGPDESTHLRRRRNRRAVRPAHPDYCRDQGSERHGGCWLEESTALYVLPNLVAMMQRASASLYTSTNPSP
jgi:hypothetical protein